MRETKDKFGKYLTRVFPSMYLGEKEKLGSSNGEKTEVYSGFSVALYSDGEELPIKAIAIEETSSKNPSERYDEELEFWCRIGAAVLCSFNKDLSQTEAEMVLADMLMAEATQVYNNGTLRANLLYLTGWDQKYYMFITACR